MRVSPARVSASSAEGAADLGARGVPRTKRGAPLRRDVIQICKVRRQHKARAPRAGENTGEWYRLPADREDTLMTPNVDRTYLNTTQSILAALQYAAAPSATPASIVSIVRAQQAALATLTVPASQTDLHEMMTQSCSDFVHWAELARAGNDELAQTTYMAAVALFELAQERVGFTEARRRMAEWKRPTRPK